MEASEVKDLLPPVVLSLGAILPFLVAAPPFAVPTNARVLLSTIMALTIWTGYWSAFALGEVAFSTVWIPVTLVLITLVIFAFLFHVAQRPPAPKMRRILETDGQGHSVCKKVPVLDTNSQPILAAQIDEARYLWLYLL